MNILYHFRTRGTGAEAVHISGVARAFERRGHTVTFSSPTGIDPRRTAGASPFKAPGKESWIARLARKCPRWCFELMELGYNASAFLRNRRLLHRDTFQLIYERHAFYLFATAWLARRTGIPLVVEVNELAGDQRIREQPIFIGFARWCDRFTFSRAHRIVVVSPHLKRRVEALGIDGGKVLVLPNAVDEDDCGVPASGDFIRQKWNLNHSVVIGFAGWFVEWHKLDTLMAVFAKLCANHDLLHLMLVGEGTLEEQLRSQAASLGVAGKITFTGAVTHSAMPAHMAAMDICVVPHSNEYRSPIKLFEYMAQGRTVIAPRTEPIEMVIHHGSNGLLFEPGNEQELAGVLSTAIVDQGLRKRMGKQAILDVLSKHTWRRNAEIVFSELNGYGHDTDKLP